MSSHKELNKNALAGNATESMNEKICPCTISLLLSGVTVERHSPDTHSASQSVSSIFLAFQLSEIQEN